MLKRENFTEEHIRNLQQSTHRNPILLERAGCRFDLLDAHLILLAYFLIEIMIINRDNIPE